MPSVTISISAEAHARLKKLKQRGESFSDVLLREVPDPDATLPQIVRQLWKETPPRRRHAKKAAA